ncbi:response regulator [bacterium]|nr:response regulator [bacterium]MCI0565839.1 response regulator [bacterium]MCI0680298.1 response regulator [bacterium]
MAEEKKKTVLVVEDEKALRDVVIDRLKYEGYEALSAENGEEGLKKALESHPDLILLDHVMPKMDGLHMLKKLREDEWGKSANVIVLTNLSDTGTVAQATEHGVYDFLVKSDWSLEKVVEKVKEKLG